MYNVSDVKQIFPYGLKTNYGGGKSSGFGLIYDSIEAAKRFEPNFRLARVSIEYKSHSFWEMSNTSFLHFLYCTV